MSLEELKLASNSMILTKNGTTPKEQKTELSENLRSDIPFVSGLPCMEVIEEEGKHRWD